ncbi:hypothetical protein RHECNPAF_930038 [Rhizobium etli CNPAF512]|nr:hypothetical protein RHECNPAF_930038 [Rhizobium etli CNPAF512]
MDIRAQARWGLEARGNPGHGATRRLTESHSCLLIRPKSPGGSG